MAMPMMPMVAVVAVVAMMFPRRASIGGAVGATGRVGLAAVRTWLLNQHGTTARLAALTTRTIISFLFDEKMNMKVEGCNGYTHVLALQSVHETRL